MAGQSRALNHRYWSTSTIMPRTSKVDAPPRTRPVQVARRMGKVVEVPIVGVIGRIPAKNGGERGGLALAEERDGRPVNLDLGNVEAFSSAVDAQADVSPLYSGGAGIGLGRRAL